MARTIFGADKDWAEAAKRLTPPAGQINLAPHLGARPTFPQVRHPSFYPSSYERAQKRNCPHRPPAPRGRPIWGHPPRGRDGQSSPETFADRRWHAADDASCSRRPRASGRSSCAQTPGCPHAPERRTADASETAWRPRGRCRRTSETGWRPDASEAARRPGRRCSRRAQTSRCPGRWRRTQTSGRRSACRR